MNVTNRRGPEVWTLNCPKKVHLLQLCADLRKKLNSV